MLQVKILSVEKKLTWLKVLRFGVGFLVLKLLIFKFRLAISEQFYFLKVKFLMTIFCFCRMAEVDRIATGEENNAESSKVNASR